MKNDALNRLLAAAEAVPAVDAHQHLGPETSVDTDLCRLILDDNYIVTDLTSAGMTADDRLYIGDGALPLMERWQRLSPLWQRVRHTSYARAHLLTLRDGYGAKDMAASEIEEVSGRLAADFKRPGLFSRVFRKRCHIDAVLTQGGYFRHADPPFFHIERILDIVYDYTPEGLIAKQAGELGITVRTLDDLTHAMEAIVRRHRARGAVGYKIAAIPWRAPSLGELRSAFQKCRKATAKFKPGTPEYDAARFPLVCHFVAITARIAGEVGLPVSIHTGAPWANWLDFRAWEPTELIPLLGAFRDTRFDIYHAGIPFGTPASMMGKAFANVWMNLCWAHIISEELAMRAVSEWLDMIPLNKVLGFGGDYNNRTVSVTYGHLVLARRNICRVLAQRVEAGRMTEPEAKAVLQSWLSDNPRALYRLPTAASA